MLPPWVAYLVALIRPETDWLDIEMLKLGMNVEWASAAIFPFLGGLALDPRPPRAVRLGLFVALGLAVSMFIGQALGPRASGLFWLNGGVTYAGWLWTRPNESRFETMLSRAILTVATLIPLLFVVIVVAKLTGADALLLLGFSYFFTLHALDVTATFTRFHRWFVGLQRRGREHGDRM